MTPTTPPASRMHASAVHGVHTDDSLLVHRLRPVRHPEASLANSAEGLGASSAAKSPSYFLRGSYSDVWCTRGTQHFYTAPVLAPAMIDYVQVPACMVSNSRFGHETLAVYFHVDFVNMLHACISPTRRLFCICSRDTRLCRRTCLLV